MNKKILSIRFYLIYGLLIASLLNSCDKRTETVTDKVNKKDSLAFGDTKFLSNGLTGKMYLLTPGTRAIPLFDTINSVNTIYTDSINVPVRSWSSGFPGLPDRFEWFAIEYKGRFKTITQGEYTFRLVSDDGSKLFIDDSVVINNDGLHSVVSKAGKINLDNAEHTIKVQYFQGPRWSIALQLFARLDNEPEQIFPGKYFEIASSGNNLFTKNILYLIAAIILLILLLFLFTKRKKSKK